MKRDRLLRIALACLFGLVIAAILAWTTIRHDERRATANATGTGQAAVGGPFSLVDHTGQPVTDQDYAGRYKLVFFGFTFCPDICPTELQTIAQAMDQLGPEEQAQVQPLFITIDPERDRPAVLAEYAGLFHPRIVGLTGTPEQVAAVAKAYRVYYARSEDAGEGPEYMMDHSTFVYLMGPDGRFITLFRNGVTADELVTALRAELAKKMDAR